MRVYKVCLNFEWSKVVKNRNHLDDALLVIFLVVHYFEESLSAVQDV